MAVVSGMLKTLIEGRPPHILIEFGPNDAAGTAGCNPFHFVEFMYAAGYRMYEGAKAAGLRSLLDVELPFALSGKGRRVFEAYKPPLEIGHRSDFPFELADANLVHGFR